MQLGVVATLSAVTYRIAIALVLWVTFTAGTTYPAPAPFTTRVGVSDATGAFTTVTVADVSYVDGAALVVNVSEAVRAAGEGATVHVRITRCTFANGAALRIFGGNKQPGVSAPIPVTAVVEDCNFTDSWLLLDSIALVAAAPASSISIQRSAFSFQRDMGVADITASAQWTPPPLMTSYPMQAGLVVHGVDLSGEAAALTVADCTFASTLAHIGSPPPASYAVGVLVMGAPVSFVDGGTFTLRDSRVAATSVGKSGALGVAFFVAPVTVTGTASAMTVSNVTTAAAVTKNASPNGAFGVIFSSSPVVASAGGRVAVVGCNVTTYHALRLSAPLYVYESFVRVSGGGHVSVSDCLLNVTAAAEQTASDTGAVSFATATDGDGTIVVAGPSSRFALDNNTIVSSIACASTLYGVRLDGSGVTLQVHDGAVLSVSGNDVALSHPVSIVGVRLCPTAVSTSGRFHIDRNTLHIAANIKAFAVEWPPTVAHVFAVNSSGLVTVDDLACTVRDHSGHTPNGATSVAVRVATPTFTIATGGTVRVRRLQWDVNRAQGSWAVVIDTDVTVSGSGSLLAVLDGADIDAAATAEGPAGVVDVTSAVTVREEAEVSISHVTARLAPFASCAAVALRYGPQITDAGRLVFTHMDTTFTTAVTTYALRSDATAPVTIEGATWVVSHWAVAMQGGVGFSFEDASGLMHVVGKAGLLLLRNLTVAIVNSGADTRAVAVTGVDLLVTDGSSVRLDGLDATLGTSAASHAAVTVTTCTVTLSKASTFELAGITAAINGPTGGSEGIVVTDSTVRVYADSVWRIANMTLDLAARVAYGVHVAQTIIDVQSGGTLWLLHNASLALTTDSAGVCNFVRLFNATVTANSAAIVGVAKVAARSVAATTSALGIVTAKTHITLRGGAAWVVDGFAFNVPEATLIVMGLWIDGTGSFSADGSGTALRLAHIDTNINCTGCTATGVVVSCPLLLTGAATLAIDEMRTTLVGAVALAVAVGSVQLASGAALRVTSSAFGVHAATGPAIGFYADQDVDVADTSVLELRDCRIDVISTSNDVAAAVDLAGDLRLLRGSAFVVHGVVVAVACVDPDATAPVYAIRHRAVDVTHGSRYSIGDVNVTLSGYTTAVVIAHETEAAGITLTDDARYTVSNVTAGISLSLVRGSGTAAFIALTAATPWSVGNSSVVRIEDMTGSVDAAQLGPDAATADWIVLANASDLTVANHSSFTVRGAGLRLASPLGPVRVFLVHDSSAIRVENSSALTFERVTAVLRAATDVTVWAYRSASGLTVADRSYVRLAHIDVDAGDAVNCGIVGLESDGVVAQRSALRVEHVHYRVNATTNVQLINAAAVIAVVDGSRIDVLRCVAVAVLSGPSGLNCPLYFPAVLSVQRGSAVVVDACDFNVSATGSSGLVVAVGWGLDALQVTDASLLRIRGTAVTCEAFAQCAAVAWSGATVSNASRVAIEHNTFHLTAHGGGLALAVGSSARELRLERYAVLAICDNAVQLHYANGPPSFVLLFSAITYAARALVTVDRNDVVATQDASGSSAASHTVAAFVRADGVPCLATTTEGLWRSRNNTFAAAVAPSQGPHVLFNATLTGAADGTVALQCNLINGAESFEVAEPLLNPAASGNCTDGVACSVSDASTCDPFFVIFDRPFCRCVCYDVTALYGVPAAFVRFSATCALEDAGLDAAVAALPSVTTTTSATPSRRPRTRTGTRTASTLVSQTLTTTATHSVAPTSRTLTGSESVSHVRQRTVTDAVATLTTTATGSLTLQAPQQPPTTTFSATLTPAAATASTTLAVARRPTRTHSLAAAQPQTPLSSRTNTRPVIITTTAAVVAPEVVPQDDAPKQVQQNVANAQVVVAGAIGSPTGAVAMQRIAVLSQFCVEFNETAAAPLAWLDSPTGARIGDSGLRYQLGAIVVNPLLVLAVWCAAAAAAVGHWRFALHRHNATHDTTTPGQPSPPEPRTVPSTSLDENSKADANEDSPPSLADSLVATRALHFAYFAFAVLMQPTVTACGVLCAVSRDFNVVAGAALVALCYTAVAVAVSVVFLWWYLPAEYVPDTRHTDGAAAAAAPSRQLPCWRRVVEWLVRPRGAWLHIPLRQYKPVVRLACVETLLARVRCYPTLLEPVFADFSGRRHWFGLVELIVSAVLGVLLAMSAVVRCVAVSAILVVVAAAYVVLLLALRPYAARLDEGLAVFLAVLVFAAAVALASGGKEAVLSDVLWLMTAVAILRSVYELLKAVARCVGQNVLALQRRELRHDKQQRVFSAATVDMSDPALRAAAGGAAAGGGDDNDELKRLLIAAPVPVHVDLGFLDTLTDAYEGMPSKQEDASATRRGPAPDGADDDGSAAVDVDALLSGLLPTAPPQLPSYDHLSDDEWRQRASAGKLLLAALRSTDRGADYSPGTDRSAELVKDAPVGSGALRLGVPVVGSRRRRLAAPAAAPASTTARSDDTAHDDDDDFAGLL